MNYYTIYFFNQTLRFDRLYFLKALSMVPLFMIVFFFSVDMAHLIPILDAWDKQAMIALNFAGSETTDHFWYLYSDKKIWAPLVIVALVTLFRDQPGTIRQKTLVILATILLVAVFDQVSSSLIKPLVCRLRPSHAPAISSLLHYVNNYHGGAFGFVSGHATNTMGIATWLALIYRNRLSQLSLILFAVMMGYSRIYLGVHYPGDVICGSILGATIAFIVFRIMARRGWIQSTKACPVFLLAAFYITVAGIIIAA